MPVQPALLSRLETEQENPRSRHLDEMSALDIVSLINEEDHHVAQAVHKELPAIAVAAEGIARRMAQGGRLIYIGAGTSGRLGVLDASECQPTFGVDPGRVIGVIAGGERAVTTPSEGAEDSEELGQQSLCDIELGPSDAVVGIAASGRTPFVIGALRYARSVGALTIGLSCTSSPDMGPHADTMISPIVGAEVLTGSTRMKAGTAHKMVLNMLSTCAMTLLGKVYGHWMIDLKATNEKLVARAVSILIASTGVDATKATEVLASCNGNLRASVICVLGDMSPDKAVELLGLHGGQIRDCLPPARS